MGNAHRVIKTINPVYIARPHDPSQVTYFIMLANHQPQARAKLAAELYILPKEVDEIYEFIEIVGPVKVIE